MLTRRSALALPALLAARPAAAQELRQAWHDPARGRTLPVLLRLPEGEGAAPLVIVSHGLGGTREGLAYLGQALAAAGFIALHVQHPGTDESLWRGAADPRLALAAAANNPQGALERLRDAAFLLDTLPGQPALAGRVDMARLGMAGHSYGAWLVQHMLGQRLPGGDRGLALPEPRLSAGIALSPIPPEGMPPRLAFARVRAPLLSVTGTQDHSWIGGVRAESRRIPFDALPGPALLAVLEGATHASFAAQPALGDPWNDGTYQPRIAGLAVAFLRALWQGDTAAGTFLRDGAHGLLAEGDRLETRDWS
ncbi:acetylhydrolase [Roseomonas sp. GC11]|uniref:alpha/beta hydrolase family protein n=1 Tax=Roseomonas sp. GC11 TaxID=2950546 RepID=UPI00210EB039|nr:acetylhydrolase [Roseomonas sp. GC11]MCQ4161819.1 acetylhydrolase [Roseomonas sp. GC11]